MPTAMDMIRAFKERLFVIQCRKSLHEVADLSNPVVRGTGFRGILTRLWGCPLQEVRVGLPLFQGGSLSEHRRLSEACTIALVRISRRSFWLPLSLRIVGPSGHPVFPGAGGAAGLAGYGGVAAAFAEAERFGLSASFLLTESAVLHALGGLVSVPVVLESFLSPGLDLGWVWLSAVPRLSGCAGGRAFLWWLSGRPVLAFRGAAACHPPTRSAIQHEVMLEGYSFRILWGAFGSTSALDSMYFGPGRLPRS